MTVSDYIRNLLYTENCVIVPGFGGFVGNYQEAKLNFRTTEIFPPSKTIAFNQKLQKDDGLLIKSIASGDNISYELASQKVKAFVTRVNETLDKGKTVKLKALGSFSKKKSILVFEPENTSNYLKDTYGLDSFEFPLLETASKRITQPKKTLTPVKKKRRRPSLVPLIVGIPIIAALIYAPFFFQEKEYQHVFGKAGIEIPMGMNKRIIALNAADFDLERETLSAEPKSKEEADQKETTETLQEAEPVQTTEPVLAEKAEPEQEKQNPEPVSETPSASAVSTPGDYFIIGGSFSSMANAEKAVSQYKDMGYNCRIFNAGNGMNRVAIKSYETVEAAYQDLDHLRQQVGNNDLWILHR
ncbi:MAG: SPOR domain-containing protein [Candidatus Delongbacteria bacterium]|nr:SPOR domain-containing protein [Candidatus Delongbacteria bacterium]